MAIPRLLKQSLKNVWHHCFEGCQQGFGIDILPRHFYSSIPDLGYLRRSVEWRAPRSMKGISGADVEEQIRLLRQDCTAFPGLLAGRRIHRTACEVAGEVGFGEIEAEYLYCFVRAHRPQKILQIGCGVSTAVMVAGATDAGYVPRIECVEPYPSAYLKRLAKEGVIELKSIRAEVMNPVEACELSAGDVLFIDSTHAVRAGSEVNLIIHEMLPRIAAGVHVHFHDIYFPYDYHRSILTELFFPLESTLLYAFLEGNSRFSIRVSMSMLHYAQPEALRAVFPRYLPQASRDGLKMEDNGHFPSSTWLLSH